MKTNAQNIAYELNYLLKVPHNKHPINNVLKVSALGFNARRESIAKARTRFADCFVRQSVPDRLQRHFQLGYTVCGLGFSLLNSSNIAHSLVVVKGI